MHAPEIARVARIAAAIGFGGGLKDQHARARLGRGPGLGAAHPQGGAAAGGGRTCRRQARRRLSGLLSRNITKAAALPRPW